MRRRTLSEIKAYGDGYTEAYKEFCHLLTNYDVDKAMRKMKIFADAVVLTVETAKDEPQTDDIGVPWTDCQTALGEPQTETSTNLEKVQLTDEPQTDCAWRRDDG